MSLLHKENEFETKSILKENEFESQHGVHFQLIKPSLYAAVQNFMWEHYIPDEPIQRSLNMTRCWLLEQEFKDAMESGCSIAAIKDNKIVGVRLSKVVDKSHWVDWLYEKLLIFLLSLRLVAYLLPRHLKGFPICIKLLNRLKYDVWTQFGLLECDRILLCLALCSARFHGIKGLGTELIKRSDEVGRERGCQYAYTYATGIYSTRIFHKLQYTMGNSVAYDEFRDDEGQLYLKDTREHTHSTIFMKAL